MRVYMGVDPGPSTGIALLFIESNGDWKWMVFQVNADAAFWLIEMLYKWYCPRVVAIEAFIETGKRKSAKDAEVTRRIADHAFQLVCTIKRVPAAAGRKRNAGQVKPWGNDHRLEKAGFPLGPKFRDARDAGRHAMYAAVYDGKERDPLA